MRSGIADDLTDDLDFLVLAVWLSLHRSCYRRQTMSHHLPQRIPMLQEVPRQQHRKSLWCLRSIPTSLCLGSRRDRIHQAEPMADKRCEGGISILAPITLSCIF